MGTLVAPVNGLVITTLALVRSRPALVVKLALNGITAFPERSSNPVTAMLITEQEQDVRAVAGHRPDANRLPVFGTGEGLTLSA